jgi:general secretion pathway protein G
MGLRTRNGENGRDHRDGGDGVEPERQVPTREIVDLLTNADNAILWTRSLFRRHVVTSSRRQGFTLIELLVVLAILALLLGIATPRYMNSVDRSKETVLKENLFQIRDSLDKYFADNGRYPDALDDLVSRRYLRAPPIDPLTGSATTWIVVPPQDADKGRVYDVKSGAPGKAADGTEYRNW